MVVLFLLRVCFVMVFRKEMVLNGIFLVKVKFRRLDCWFGLDIVVWCFLNFI